MTRSQLLKCLVDLKVFLGHGINQDPSRRITLETYQGRGQAAVSRVVRMGEKPQALGNTTNTQTPDTKSRIRRKEYFESRRRRVICQNRGGGVKEVKQVTWQTLVETSVAVLTSI